MIFYDDILKNEQCIKEGGHMLGSNPVMIREMPLGYHSCSAQSAKKVTLTGILRVTIFCVSCSTVSLENEANTRHPVSAPLTRTKWNSAIEL